MFSRHLLTVGCRASTKSNITLQKIPCHRSFHAACKYLKRDLVVHTSQVHKSRAPVISATFVRYINAASTDNKSVEAATNSASEELVDSVPINADSSKQVEDITLEIPEPPAPFIEEITQAIATEPTLKDLGLGSNWPSGLIQQLLDYMHTTLDIPWWGAIALTTVCFRMIMLPVVIRTQRYTAQMANVQPEMQVIQEEMAEARRMQDHMEVMRLTHEMHQFMKKNNIDPIKNLWPPLIQAPIFLSFFWGLRGMVQLPLESMKDGGLWWFTDLTVPDPFYLLPLLTCSTLFCTLEMGTDTIATSAMGGNIKYVMRILPVVMFPFIMNFEGGVLCYWVTTNLFSLVQVCILRIPKVRKVCKIPEKIKHDPSIFKKPKKNFVAGFKDSWSNMKVARDIQNREMYDDIVFKKAGRKPVPKTYKYDPTKVTKLQPPNAVLSKKRD